MPRPRVRSLCGSILSAAMIGLCAAHVSAVVVYDDGGTHLVNGFSDIVWVNDSASGATTTVTIADPASIAGLASGLSVLAEANHGGKAVVDITGGTIASKVLAGSDSCVTISGGTIGALGYPSLQAHGSSGLAVLGVSGGTFPGTLSAVDNSRVTVSNVSFGAGMDSVSLYAAGPSGTPVVQASDCAFDGMLMAGNNARVDVSGSSFGADATDISVKAVTTSGAVVVDILNSGFHGALWAGDRSQVRVDAGWFGMSAGDLHSVVALTNSASTAVVDIASGMFTGGVGAFRGGRVRIGGGSFGADAENRSVYAHGLSGTTAVVDIFGGNFSQSFKAGPDGTILVYGQNLAYQPGTDLLTGTLADGTPLSVEATTSGNGQIILVEFPQVISIPTGLSLLQTGGLTTFFIPSAILPPPSECPFGAVPVRMEGVGLGRINVNGNDIDVGQANAVIQRTDRATNPDGGPYEDTVPIELVGLQLRSAERMDLDPLGGAGIDHIVITLQSDRGGHPSDPDTIRHSVGTTDIDFTMQTFDTSLTILYDVRAGSADGPILFSGADTLLASAVPWAMGQPVGTMGIATADDEFLAGVIGGSFTGFDMNGQFLQLRTTTVPEPATLSLLALGGLALLRRNR